MFSSFRWSLIDALTLNSSMDSSSLKKWIYAKHIAGDVPEDVGIQFVNYRSSYDFVVN